MSVTSLAGASLPLILALDVGTSSVRAVLYDARGVTVEGLESRTVYQMKTTPDGGVEMDADELCGIICHNVDELLRQAGEAAEGIRGVAMCTFWHSLLGVNEDGKAVTPIYNWSDTRSAPDVLTLSKQVDAAWLHARTGCVPHASYYPAKLLWVRRINPELFARVARWMSPSEYFFLKLFGKARCGVSMASGTGLLNQHSCVWDEEVLKALGIESSHLSPLTESPDGDEPFVGLQDEYAKRWPVLSRLPWFPAIGDGAASNIGSGGFTAEIIAINVGTSGAMRVCWPAEAVRIPQGLWCYRASRRYVVIGGALSNGGDVYAWCQQTLKLNAEEIERKLAGLEADGHGLTVLPFFSGERSTGWHSQARAAFVGMSLNTEPVEILRASLEAVAYRFAAIYERLKREVPGAGRIVASGGGILHSTVWTQMMADVIGVPVVASAVPEASSRGAAVLALRSLGCIDDFGDAPATFGSVYEPDGANHEKYKRGRERQERLYELLIAPETEM
ncbi:MAG TPA: gluconokinase [Blastocatellia bacterium]|nr:gluconokinase [Blastocatellia bacterium]